MRKGAPIFPIAVIVLVVAGVAYAMLRGDDDDGGTIVITPTPLPSDAIGVVFSEPEDGATVSNPVTVAMIVGGAFLYPAGDSTDPEGGHLHVFVDQAPPAAGTTIVAGPNVIDISDGTNTTVLPNLSTGQHTLTAVFSDTNHVITGLAQTPTITIKVE